MSLQSTPVKKLLLRNLLLKSRKIIDQLENLVRNIQSMWKLEALKSITIVIKE